MHDGYDVLAIDVNEAQVREAATRLGCRYATIDIRDPEQVATLETLAPDATVLVNNAAILHIGGIDATDGDTLRRVLDVNLVGAHLGVRAVAPFMAAGGGGSIVNVASLDALIGMNGLSAYSASKWGLRGLTKSLALELGRVGIRVNTVCPAGGNPAMFAPWGGGLAALGDGLTHYLADRGIPREADLDEIARAVVYLASDQSGFVTGIDLPVDGGHSAGSHLPGFDTL